MKSAIQQMQIGYSLHFSFLVAFWFPVYTPSIKIFFPLVQKLLTGLIEQHTSDSKKFFSQILNSFVFLYTTPKVLESFGDQTPKLYYNT